MEDVVSTVGVLLAALLVGLKLAGMIGWSWLWVLAPVWIPGVLALGLEATAAALLGVGVYWVIRSGVLDPAWMQQVANWLTGLVG